jgi:hypothetical protein
MLGSLKESRKRLGHQHVLIQPDLPSAHAPSVGRLTHGIKAFAGQQHRLRLVPVLVDENPGGSPHLSAQGTRFIRQHAHVGNEVGDPGQGFFDPVHPGRELLDPLLQSH